MASATPWQMTQQPGTPVYLRASVSAEPCAPEEVSVVLRSKTDDYTARVSQSEIVGIVADEDFSEAAVAAFQRGAGTSFDGWRNGVAAVVEFVQAQRDLRSEQVRSQFQAALASVAEAAEEAASRFVAESHAPPQF